MSFYETYATRAEAIRLEREIKPTVPNGDFFGLNGGRRRA
jgi:hypothetical protein